MQVEAIEIEAGKIPGAYRTDSTRRDERTLCPHPLVPNSINYLVAVMMVAIVMTPIMIIAVPRMFMSMGIIAVMIVYNRVLAPVVMVPFPIMEERKPGRWERHPDMVRSQVNIGTTHYAHVFCSVPDIGIRDCVHYYWRRRRYRRDNHRRGRRGRSLDGYGRRPHDDRLCGQRLRRHQCC